MDGYRAVQRSLVLLGLVAWIAPGCAFLKAPRRYTLPRTLPAAPTLEQVVQVVNSNSGQIHSFSTDQAVLSVAGMPSLRANIAFERPKRLRLRAGLGFGGTELDVGSNDELFWMWIKRQPPLYYCRHDQFATSPARRMLPIEPGWLIEAMGITELDPAALDQDLNVLPGGRLEISTVRQTVDGPARKLTLVDGATGVVLEQSLFDARGRLVARATASRHRRDQLSDRIMPRVVAIECPRAQFSLQLDLGNVEINRPLENPGELWTMPTLADCPMVDVGNPNFQLPPVAPPPPATAPPTLSHRPRPLRRGWNRIRF
jgi:hypothetical protein